MLREKIIDISTGAEIYRDYTPEEITQVENEKKKIAELVAAQEANKAAKLALLNKLGITEEEAAVLLS